MSEYTKEILMGLIDDTDGTIDPVKLKNYIETVLEPTYGSIAMKARAMGISTKIFTWLYTSVAAFGEKITIEDVRRKIEEENG